MTIGPAKFYGRPIVKYWLVAVTLFFSHYPLANDFPFKIHDEADVIYTRDKRLENYQLALGIYKKVRNRWQPEKGFKLSGKLKGQTLELSESYDPKEVFNFYLRQLPSQLTTTLFFCESRDCGDSSVWANSHFNVRQLYGLDRFQFYGVYQSRLKIDSQIRYITLYTVRRGNNRVYAHIDIFLPDSAESNPRSEFSTDST